jgi:Protein of unknown function (DUF2917)
MKFTIDKMPLGLSARKPLNIDDARGFTLRVLGGRVWVTQEGYGEDVFLDPGSDYHFQHDGRVVISVEGSDDATIVFDGPLSIESQSTVRDVVRRMFDWRSFDQPVRTSALGSP